MTLIDPKRLAVPVSVPSPTPAVKPVVVPTPAPAPVLPAAVDTFQAPASRPIPLPPPGPGLDDFLRERLQLAESKKWDAAAAQLEQQGPPKPEDFFSSPLDLPGLAAYGRARRDYGAQLEQAQQGAKLFRETRLRHELAKTEKGRELLEFEQRAGVEVRILTDAEWRAAGHGENVAGVSYGDTVDIPVTNTRADVYVHELTHQVDSKTGILAPEGDLRPKALVIAQAEAKYRAYGLDPSEVRAVVDATFHNGSDRDALTHGHTRLAEARLYREEAGGPPLTEAEVRAVLELSVQREKDINATDLKLPFALQLYAQQRGIDPRGRTPEELRAAIQQLADDANAAITTLQQNW